MPKLIIAPSCLNPTRRRVVALNGDAEAQARALYPAIPRWRVETDGEDYYAVGVPGDPISAAIAAINWWSLAASIALSFISGKLLAKPPKSPASMASLEAASPTYRIGGLQNQARLGAVIPVVYGTVTMNPDYAAQPVVEYINNEQYLKAILCAGSGTCDVSELFLGETSANSFDANVVSWRVFKPTDHNSTFGTIEAATGVYENVFTNSEVSDQELRNADTKIELTFTKIGPALPQAGGEFTITVSNGPVAADSTFTVTTETFYADNNNEETYTVTISVTAGMTDDDVANEIVRQWPHTPHPDNDSPPHAVKLSAGVVKLELHNPARANIFSATSSNTLTKQAAVAFRMSKPGQNGIEAALDFMFAGGLYLQNMSTGATQSASVEIAVTFTPVDDDGTINGTPIVHSHTFNGATTTPQRYTLKWALPVGQYLCAVVRVTPDATASNISDKINWTALKFKLVAPATPVYGDVTLVAMTVRATHGVSSEASGKARLRVTRLLDVIDGTAKVATHNPVDAMVDVLTAHYGGRRPMTGDELDLEELRLARAKWAAHNGFNAIFDKPTTVWEAMASAVSVVAAVPLPQGDRVSLAHDCVKDTRSALFTDHNIVADSLQIGYEFNKVGDPQGVRVEYRKGELFDPASVYLPPNIDDVESVTLFGCTDEATATQYGNLLNNRRKYRRKTIQFETELDGALCVHGQRIGVAHSTPEWGTSATVKAVSGRKLQMDTELDPSTSSILIRDDEGVPHHMTFTHDGPPGLITLDAEPTFMIPTRRDDMEPAVCAVGVATKEVTDWIVLSMEPAGEYRIKISAMAYDPDVYIGAMPHQLIDHRTTP